MIRLAVDTEFDPTSVLLRTVRGWGRFHWVQLLASCQDEEGEMRDTLGVATTIEMASVTYRSQ